MVNIPIFNDGVPRLRENLLGISRNVMARRDLNPNCFHSFAIYSQTTSISYLKSLVPPLSSNSLGKLNKAWKGYRKAT